jgi:phosphate/phosphite/phosphonate ABC transporter binding protein
MIGWAVLMESLSHVTTRNGTRRTPGRSRRPLRLITYLAPNLFWFYQFVSRYLAKKLQYPTELSVGSDYAELRGRADLAFVCGLPYVEHTRLVMPRIEPLVAPVLSGERYGGKPIYFSDVIVRQNSPFWSFSDLRGRSWAFNEPHSQSGYGITRYYLVQKRETNGYFSRVVEAGYHELAIQMVCSGEVDASAIDSHVLALLMRDDPALANMLRVIDTFGPSPIQPIVTGTHLSNSLKCDVEKVLLGMGDDRTVKPVLARALVERFEPVSDSTYDDIRRMRAIAEAVQFLTIR